MEVFDFIRKDTLMFDGDVDDVRQFQITNDFPIGGLVTSSCPREENEEKTFLPEG